MVFSKLGGKRHRNLRRPFIRSMSTSQGGDLRFHLVDPNGSSPTKNIVIVMDGLTEFTPEVLEWVLQNIVTRSGCAITLLGVMPWLNIPLSTKTWLDIWSVDLEELAKERSENIKSDFKYLKLKAVLDLCRSYGVVLQKKVVMGYPSRLLVVEQIISLGATWVVFDRHQKNTEFYAKKVPCNMVVMNENGEADMIKGRTVVENSGEMNTATATAGESPTVVPPPELVISNQLKGFIENERSQGIYDDQEYDDNEVVLCV
ncbi:uncharacterized protein LOC133777876 [Humulus lupulus]|uniref:uncharacterized protein LOC133777876 n=1 Tax=Humulus lupulus TaxID=3486 RepID=UPI002B40BA09|nr:uncharacterized protein LOC133777876 [Humulus lupulus]XP_062073615.1 uncharacterized protein LOC133777876 [Humulus lupulus]